MITGGFYPGDLPARDPIPAWGLAAMAASATISMALILAAWWLA